MISAAKRVWGISVLRPFAAYRTNINSAMQTSKTDITLAQPAVKDNLFSKVEIELRGVDPGVLKSYSWFAITAAQHLGIEVGSCWTPRKANHERMTLLKSVHIYKKHRVQYEIRTYFRYIHFHKLTGSTLETFMEYIERNLPEGITLNATKTELQYMPQHMQQSPTASNSNTD